MMLSLAARIAPSVGLFLARVICRDAPPLGLGKQGVRGIAGKGKGLEVVRGRERLQAGVTLLLVVDDYSVHGLALYAGPLNVDGHGLSIGGHRVVSG
jgi:hypothetical protein